MNLGGDRLGKSVARRDMRKVYCMKKLKIKVKGKIVLRRKV